MNDEQAIEFGKVRDDSSYQRDGTLRKERVYTFWIGKHGPFTERVALENFDPSEIERRIAALKQHLGFLPK